MPEPIDSGPPFTIETGPAFIHVVGSGFWTPQDVDAHFDRLAVIVRNEREAKGVVRTMVDLRDAAVQSAEATARLDVRTRLAYRPGDRVAIVLRSSLAKMQMRRIVRTAQHSFFISHDAAKIWLLAYGESNAA